MSYEKGSLSIHSENIFPIIKKWLYSDHDIFMRELISNGCDAITKVQRLNSLGEADLKGDNDFKVKVIFDKEAKTIKFIDNGIGMTGDEIKKYINQIAFSGAEDFLNKYKDKADMDQIIGHFGLGFYSAFMVSDVVEIDTLSYQEGATPVKWSCSGGTDFEMEEGSKTSRGTEITLYLGEDGAEFNDEFRLKSVIEKYCSFMPYPVYFVSAGEEESTILVSADYVEPVVEDEADDGEEVVEAKEEEKAPKIIRPINETKPLYTRKPNECSDEEYREFYSKTFADFREPLFWIHLNMDYPFNLKGILYFPRFNSEFDNLEGTVKLYNNQVFVADNVKEVVPEFLLLLKGVIDCPDLPLNVSRSFLQNDGFAKKISDYISKKVADKLNELFKSSREEYEKFWDDINPFIKFGSLKDPKFYDKVESSVLFKTTAKDYVTVDEYLEKFEDKVGSKNIYYVSDEVQQAQYVHLIQSHEIEAVIAGHQIDSPFLGLVESKKEGVNFVRVDSDVSELLKAESKEEEAEAVKAEEEKLTNTFKEILSLDVLNLKLENLKNESVSGMIILSESNRRMQDMMKAYGMSGMDPSMFPSNEVLVLNRNNSLVKYILEDKGEGDSELKSMIVHQIFDLAQMGHRQLTPEAMSQFIQRSGELMNKAIK